MGVIGLWSILDAGARPVRLEALAKKRLAVDASIWIYQFLKAVRDKEGNVLKNAHVVGFFRRICKLLFHGIQPVFVFDGKAPLLKKQTLRNRKVLREGGRVDVAKTAGKILAVQMRKRALEESARQQAGAEENDRIEEAVPENPVYFDELELRPVEVQKQRFKKADQYHLPALETEIDRAGSVNDPRIMTHEELQAYAREFEGGEDMNLYDFSNIDYDSHMFTSLPHADQYSILNAARLRSRLRMGLSTEQLTDMFPDRMAFSRFQIERVKERSDLTNRLMNLNGMNDVGVQRIASERGREYVLIKNENVDGGWSLGVVNSAEKPIIIDKQLEQADEEDEDEDVAFEDVPIGPEGDQGELQDFTGMTEDDMIKFALEESRRAQMSSTKPDTTFRPSERRNHEKARTHNPARPSTATGKDAPLFLRDDSQQDGDFAERERSPRPLLQDSPANATTALTWEEEEAAELREAMALSMVPKSPSPALAGGFILEDDEDIQMPQMQTKTSAPQKSKDDELAPRPAFSLPFPKIDFSASMLHKNGAVSSQKTAAKQAVPNTAALPEAQTSLAKIQRVMQSIEELDGTDVEAAAKEDIGPEAKTPEATDATPADHRRPVPSWFEEEVGAPVALPDSATIESPSEEPSYGLANQLPQTVDLTHDDTSDSNESDVEITDAPLPKYSEPQVPSEIANHQPMSFPPTSATRVVETQPRTPQVTPPPAADEQALPADNSGGDVGLVESPDWSEVEDDDAHPASQDVPGEERSTEAVDLALPTDDTVLDEADQTRLAEEEDLLVAMAAEEDEYARFSAELGNKNLNNYTDAEYEQDLKNLKNQQKKNLRDADEVTQIMVLECQELLAQFGIPYITAASEAESQCAKLVQLGLVDGIVTDDSDVFLFGGTRVYRNMFNTAKTVQCYVLSDLEREFELDREKLIKLAYLLGSDYTEGIKKIGPVLALELVAEFAGDDGLEKFRDYVDRVQGGGESDDDQVSAFRKKFRKTAEKLVLPDNFPNPMVKKAYIEPEVDPDASQFEWGQPDVDALRNFLMRQCGWHQEYTDSQLLPVIKDMNMKLREGTQRNLTDFFTGSVGAGAGGPRTGVKSTRMHNALTSLRKGSAGAGDSAAIAPTKTKTRKRSTSTRPKTGATVSINQEDSNADEDLGTGRSRTRGNTESDNDMPPPRRRKTRKASTANSKLKASSRTATEGAEDTHT